MGIRLGESYDRGKFTQKNGSGGRDKKRSHKSHRFYLSACVVDLAAGHITHDVFLIGLYIQAKGEKVLWPVKTRQD